MISILTTAAHNMLLSLQLKIYDVEGKEGKYIKINEEQKARQNSSSCCGKKREEERKQEAARPACAPLFLTLG